MAKGLIVFVHGLGGHPTKTWGSFAAFIAQDEVFSSYDLAFYQYPTSLFRAPFSKKYSSIQTLADALRTLLRHKYSSHMPIVIVAHSLGGLISRQFIVEELRRNAPMRVQKLLLYASPLNGAGLAETASYISWRHRQLDQLSRGSDLIVGLNRDWEYLQAQKKVRTWHVVAGQDSVVDETSARGVAWNDRVDVLIDRGHINCVKPTSKDDLSFLIFRNFILSAVDDLDEIPPLDPIPETAKPKNSQILRFTLEGAILEANMLRIPFTIWNCMPINVRMISIATEVLDYRQSIHFATGERVKLSLEGNESSLFDGRTCILKPDESESYDLAYRIPSERGHSSPSITLGLKAIYHTQAQTNQTALAEWLIIYDSLRSKVHLLDEELLFSRVSSDPFFNENLNLVSTFIKFLPEKRDYLWGRMLSVFNKAMQDTRDSALRENRRADAEAARDLMSSIVEHWVIRRDGSLVWALLSDPLKRARSLHLRYFGLDRYIQDEILELLFKCWDPLGLKNNAIRNQEYDDLVHHIYNWLLNRASEEELLSHLAALDIAIGANSREELMPFVQALQSINLSKIWGDESRVVD